MYWRADSLKLHKFGMGKLSPQQACTRLFIAFSCFQIIDPLTYRLYLALSVPGATAAERLPFIRLYNYFDSYGTGIFYIIFAWYILQLVCCALQRKGPPET